MLVTVGTSVMAAREAYFPADLYLAHRLQGIDVAPFEDTLTAVDKLGDAPGMAVVYVLALVALWWWHYRIEALFLLLTAPLRLLSSLVKEMVERPRPLPDLVQVTDKASGYSFPSGHAFGAVLLFGLLIYLAGLVLPWRPLRWTVQGLCLLLMLLMGMARVELGAHWPSDVVGGYLWGGLTLFLLIWVHRHYGGTVGRWLGHRVEEVVSR